MLGKPNLPETDSEPARLDAGNADYADNRLVEKPGRNRKLTK